MLSSWRTPVLFIKFKTDLYGLSVGPGCNTLHAKQFGLKKKINKKFIDLGSGDGRVVVFAALNYGIRSFGIEINDNLVQEAIECVKSLKQSKNYKKRFFKKINIRKGDFFDYDISEYDYIYIYSLPTMHRYLKHVFN